MSDYPVGLLERRYLVVLVLVALLVLLNQVLVQPPLLQLATDAPVINVAGRQRMLSQRLAKAALALEAASSDADRRRHRAELAGVLGLWTASHRALRQGDRARSLPGRNSAAVRQAFDDLEPYFAPMRDAAARLARSDDAVAREDIGAILAREVCQRALAEQRHRTLLEQFSHAARTTTIGEMASGLAHELNQPLGAIANYAEGCLVALDAPRPALGEIKAALEKLLATTLRAGQIIQRIRRFVTRQEVGREPFEPNRVALEAAELLGDEAQRRAITLKLDLAPELRKIQGDPVQVQQVLVNLVGNALDALAASESAEPTVVMQTRRAGSDGVEFRVSDNGEGIPEEHLAKVFDAYFSTRAGGMGMGLAISRTIVEAHRGRIAVESVPGSWTTFRFTLPVACVDDADARPDGVHRGR
jgi:signal transduction histidine kinase